MTLADQARKIRGVTAAESALTGLLVAERDLPIADYDRHNAHDIIAKLKTISQHELRMIGAYEAKHENRVTVTDRIAALKGVEPWSGYDGQKVADITVGLTRFDAETARGVGSYERGHKHRPGVLEAVASHTAG